MLTGPHGVSVSVREETNFGVSFVGFSRSDPHDLADSSKKPHAPARRA